MKAVFVIDPLDTLDPRIDTSLGLMRAARDRGLVVWVTQAQELGAVGGRAFAAARPWPTLDGAQHVWLDEAAAVFMRTEPPLDETYLAATFVLDLVDPARTAMVNSPGGLRAVSEHLFPLQFPDLIPATLVSAGERMLRSFVDEHKTVIVKPVDGFAGRGVFRVEAGEPNLASLIETCTRRGQQPVVAQAYLPEVVDGGNKRLFVVDGVPIGAVQRYPAPGDFRIGPPADVTDVTAGDRALCARLAPALQAHGLRLTGVDVIADRLIEVNVTSPGAMQKADALLGTTFCLKTLEMLLP